MGIQYLAESDPQDLTLGRLLAHRVKEAPDEVFFTWENQAITHAEFDDRVERMAGGLSQAGVQAGTHAITMMDTSPDYLVVWFALARLGAVEVSINPAYHGELLAHQVATSEATVAIVEDRLASRLRDVRFRAPMLDMLIVRDAERVPEGELRLRDLGPSKSDGVGMIDADSPYDSLAGIIFTSGTTGASKGVKLTHHYLAAYGCMYAEVNELGRDDVILNFLPFFHLSGKFLTLATLRVGCRMRLQPKFSVSSFWEEVRNYGVTNFLGVGGICNMLLSQPPHPDDAVSTIRTVYAVPDPEDIHREFEERYGCRMTTVFGSTEAGLPIVRQASDEYVPGSCGRESPYYEVAIVDEHDHEVPVGESGEIVVRAKRPYLLGSGYIGMPERTIRSWRNLWLHTGDRGRRDERGWFWFEDRTSDALRRRGENISSFEVEGLVSQHPAVAEAAAVAAESEVGEDEVWVLVTLREGVAVTPEELMHHCAKVMPYFMIPRYYEMVTDFPRTPTAKIEKYKLRSGGPGVDAWDREAHGWFVRRGELVHDPAST